MWPVGRSVGQLRWMWGEVAGELVGQAGLHFVGARAGLVEERGPGSRAQRVGAFGRVGAAGLVEAGQGGAERAAMFGADLAGPDAFEKCGDGGVAVVEVAERVAVAAGDRERAVDAGGGQVTHEADEPGEVGRVDGGVRRG